MGIEGTATVVPVSASVADSGLAWSSLKEVLPLSVSFPGPYQDLYRLMKVRTLQDTSLHSR